MAGSKIQRHVNIDGRGGSGGNRDWGLGREITSDGVRSWGGRESRELRRVVEDRIWDGRRTRPSRDVNTGNGSWCF